MNLAFITGVSRGIGYETALKFFQNDWQVVGLSRTVSPELPVQQISVDLEDMDLSLIQSSCEEQLKEANKICFIHCAGITTTDSILNLDETQFRQIFEVNVISAMKMIRFLVPYMKENSSIVLIGSTLSYIGVPLSCSYTISKHALSGLSRSISQDLSHKKIYSCCICPGFVDTHMLKEVVSSRGIDMEDLKSMQLFERLIHPKEIANYAYFCAENPIVNGSVIQADLGGIK